MTPSAPRIHHVSNYSYPKMLTRETPKYILGSDVLLVVRWSANRAVRIDMGGGDKYSGRGSRGHIH